MNPADDGTGIVLAAYGRGALVLTEGHTVHCGLIGRDLRLVCGDVVAWRRDALADHPSVHAVEARRNCIERIDARGRPEPVAANLDRLAIMVAPEPATDWFLVDRYWAAAVQCGIDAVLIVNKSDQDMASMSEEIANFNHLGLPCTPLCCRAGSGLPTVRELLRQGVTLLVGQSGVGKSTLVNELVPSAGAQTMELGRDREGRHTTTTARRYRLDGEAAIVDAPGVRDFAPPARFSRAAERGFVEILGRSADCRFNDCRHLQEPGCAVRSALDAGEISARRYESYRRLLRLHTQFASR